MNDDELIIRLKSDGSFTLESPRPNMDFIEYLKRRVPSADREYDPDLFVWTIRGEQYLAPIEGVAVQKFRFAQRIYRNSEGKLVYKNLKSGVETVQENLF